MRLFAFILILSENGHNAPTVQQSIDRAAHDVINADLAFVTGVFQRCASRHLDTSMYRLFEHEYIALQEITVVFTDFKFLVPN